MEEIMKQIIQIDSVAFNAKKNNEELLKSKKEEYEEEIKAYREITLERARKEADKIYEQTIASGEALHQQEKEKCKVIAKAIESQYIQVEGELLERIFRGLFEMEG